MSEAKDNIDKLRAHRLQLDRERRVDIVIAEVVLLKHRVVEAAWQAPLFYVLNLRTHPTHNMRLGTRWINAGWGDVL